MNILFLEREKLLIPFKCYREDAISPLKAYPDSAGHDLYANETKILSANGRVLVRIDLNFTILKGFFGQIVERLGLANLHGLCAFNGIIDADYRGAICVVLFNFSDDDYTVEKGNRIAQINIQRFYDVKYIE